MDVRRGRIVQLQHQFIWSITAFTEPPARWGADPQGDHAAVVAQRFSGAQIERHSLPAFGIDERFQCHESLHLGVVGHPLDVAIAVVLPEHHPLRIQRPQRGEHLGLLVAQLAGVELYG